MTLDPRCAGDIACIDFAPDPEFEPLLEAARRLADNWARPRAATADAAGRARRLDAAELMPQWHAQACAAKHLFLLARTLAQGDAAGAWHELADAPAALLAPGLPSCTIALPRAAGVLVDHVAWLSTPAEADRPVAWPDAALRTLLGPTTLPAAQAPLIGLPAARSLHWPPGALCTGEAPVLAVLAHRAWAAFVDAQAALMLGLIDGVAERLVREAYAYARQRVSAGKPIAQHQAVALRLADLALNQQALSLYLHAAVEHPAAVGSADGPVQINVAHVSELAQRISRDALQVAAAHGYVEGLPFKRLFEQTRAFLSMLACACGGRIRGAMRRADLAAAAAS